MRLRHVRRVVPSLLCALGLTVVVLATPSVAGGTAVLIKDFVFEPANVTIVLGDTMTWTNTGQNTHTTTADDGTWSSGGVPPGGSFATGPFTRLGTHVYRCTIHPLIMQGSVTVVLATPPPTPTAPPPTQRTTPPTPTPSATPTASPSPTPSPAPSPSATSSTATPTGSPVGASATPSSPPAAPTSQNPTQLAGVALIAVGVALLGVAFWWRFGRA